jgi:plastocyanin
LSLIAVASLAATACASRIETTETGPEGPMVQIHATDDQLTPDHIEAKPGEVINVELTNEGKASHSLVFDLPGGNQSMGNVLEPGGSGSMRVVAPARAGTYDFYSPVGKDREQGLKGTLVVTAVPGSVKIKPQPPKVPKR